MQASVLKNGFEGNINPPKKDGDVGFDLKSKSAKVVGDGLCLDSNQTVSKAFFLDSSVVWKRIDYIEYDTGVCIAPEEGFYSTVQPNSRCTKMNLVLGNSRGIIDNGYRNSIRFRYKYVYQPTDLVSVKCYTCKFISIDPDKVFGVGDVCGQLTFHEIFVPKTYSVDILTETDRGLGGFGSTENE
jgi:dUTPase